METKKQSSESIAVVCFQWNTGFREYKAEYVNTLARMVSRNLSLPHRFICITDEKKGFENNVEVIPTPKSAKQICRLQSPEGSRFPASYRRLWLFSKGAEFIADRVLLLDIDCIITGSIDHLFDFDDDFVGWRPMKGRWSKQNRIGGGTWLLRTGTHSWVWDSFIEDPALAIKKARSNGYRGSDQAWMSYCLANSCKVWLNLPGNSGSFEAGIYQNQDGVKKWEKPPKNASIVHFNGVEKPWSVNMQRKQWIKEYWT